MVISYNNFKKKNVGRADFFDRFTKKLLHVTNVLDII